MEKRLRIHGMHCANCVQRIEEALRRISGVKQANVHLALGEAVVVLEKPDVDDTLLERAVAEVGYRATVLSDAEETTRSDTSRNGRASLQFDVKRLIVATILALPVLGISMLHMHFPGRNELLWALCTPLQFWCGLAFLGGAWAALKRRKADMDTLIALSTLTAYGQGTVVMILNWFGFSGGEVYFEAQAGIILLVLLGQFLEARARVRATSALERLWSLQPARAHVLREGEEVEVPISDLQPGDIVILRPGDRVPADGEVLEGESAINESMLTGEAQPVPKKAGDSVFAGTLNTTGALRVRVTAVGSGTTLAKIVALVERAQLSRVPIQKTADRIAAIFVPVVLSMALVAAVGWLVWLGPASWSNATTAALQAAVATLIIACPCALGLATPVALVVATGRAAELGILFRDAAVLERAAQVGVVLFDKTGTLTEGRPEVRQALTLDPHAAEADIVSLAASAEQNSEHHLAETIIQFARAQKLQPIPATHFRSYPGRGVQAEVERQLVLIGNRDLFLELGVALPRLAELRAEELAVKGMTPILVAVAPKSAHAVATGGSTQTSIRGFRTGEVRILGILAVADKLRARSGAAIDRLRDLGVEPYLVTGDHSHVADAVAAQLGIRQVYAGVKPDQKARIVADLQRSGWVVAFVGDGINDAPALAQADVGIAFGSGADVAIEAGHVIILNDDPLAVPAALELARRTRRIIYGNLFWAFLYNVLAVPAAALGWLHPMMAAAAMSLSSLSVVLNSLRLRRVLQYGL
ncbi:MAG: heavy metal translocating P-type ATPase [Gemmatales bacterium]|nr:heavy metal translocating P-type ATPase [Gemmatales bacterium]MDW7993780.1 heavy metal translocating P-type ATPase [Gemmatales bacterium]